MPINLDFTLLIVMAGSAILGGVTGVIGVFAVLRRQSLVGDAVAHAALPGIVLGFILFGREMGPLVIGATITGWLSAMVIRAIVNTTKVKQDAAIAISLMTFFALGIVGLTHLQSSGSSSVAGIDEYIFGQAALIMQEDVQLIAVLGCAIILTLLIFWKEFKLTTFDSEFARANGFPLFWLEALLSTLIVVGLVMGLRIAGAILMIGILVAPPVAARQWTQHLGVMVVVSGLIGAFSGMAGAYISGLNAAFPTGPFIILVAFIIAVISILIAPKRGLLWRWWNRSSDRHRFAGRQVMRDLYHTLSDHRQLRAVPVTTLESLRGSRALMGLKHLEREGLVEQCLTCEHFLSGKCPSSWILTNQGLEMAEHDAHNRRLWMCYRLHAHELGLPVIQEDDELDIRSLLSANAIGWLEERLDGSIDR